ncbi:hypothetical protein CHUAL_001659, partial [Chamberlinius hualienensis]
RDFFSNHQVDCGHDVIPNYSNCTYFHRYCFWGPSGAFISSGVCWLVGQSVPRKFIFDSTCPVPLENALVAGLRFSPNK